MENINDLEMDGLFSDDELEFLDEVTANALNIEELQKLGNVTHAKFDRGDSIDEVIQFVSFDEKIEFTRFNSYKKKEAIERQKAMLQDSIAQAIKTENYEQARIYKTELDSIKG